MTDAIREELLTLASERPSWLASYADNLRRTIPASADIVIEDSCDIADGALIPAADERWPASRLRTGAVIGAVQSGKTASLIGMAARAVDTTVDVVVVLGGRQTALWHQTTERIRNDLIGSKSIKTHAFFPEPGIADKPENAYSLTPARAKRLLKAQLPIVFVAMKEIHHLHHLGAVLRKSVYKTAAVLNRDIHIMVIDDEADDASVSDDRIQFTSNEVDEFQEVPRRVVELWEDRHNPGHTCAPHVYATYVAYTATPQANFLQNAENPLIPRHFVAALRTPGRCGMRTPRELTYRVGGAARWYTGASIYYDLLGDILCEEIDAVSDTGEAKSIPSAPKETAQQIAQDGSPLPEHSQSKEDALLAHSVRTYLVGAAIRVIRSGRLGPLSAAQMVFSSRIEAKDSCAPVMSMLIHPAAAMDSHFAVRDRLLLWWNGEQGVQGAGVLEDLCTQTTEWVRIYDSYLRSARIVSERLGDDASDCSIPNWADVEDVLREEMIPATKVAVINSHADADERPDFAIHEDQEGQWRAPVNHSTIFISGNVMSRGLTLEGLLTTVFTRVSHNPLADTQMQMQRWFGYRGSYIDLCRVLLTPTQKSLFFQYAQSDTALRRQILAAMEKRPNNLPEIAVLQGADYFATGKVSGISSVSLLPGTRPVVRYMNQPDDDQHNLTLVSSFFENLAGDLIVDKRGLLAAKPLTLVETASLLDGLRYRNHGRMADQIQRWAQVEAMMELDPRLHSNIAPIYRAPLTEGISRDLSMHSPYVLAAYLRTWAAAAIHGFPGLISADTPPQRWDLINSSEHISRLPEFRIGLRFGGGKEITNGPLGDLGRCLDISVRPMQRDVDENGELVAGWGSRGRLPGGGYQGDDVFDGVVSGHSVEVLEDGTRASGEKGLLLFQLISRGPGLATISVAMSIPCGGPDYVQAVNTRNRRREHGSA